MAPKPPYVRLVDDCHPPSRHHGGGGCGCGRQRGARKNNLACQIAWRRVAALVLFFAAMLTGATFLAIFLTRKFPSNDPLHTVAITYVTGLDVLSPAPSSSTPPPPAGTLPALSPVFNLTFQIDNTRNAFSEACFPAFSRADVSYWDTFLAGGSVPPLCAGTRKRTIVISDGGVTARAWGENVAVPRFLRDQLAAELAAGDAAVDVKVTMRMYCDSTRCGDAMLSCKPKIGGGMSPACRVDFL